MTALGGRGFRPPTATRSPWRPLGRSAWVRRTWPRALAAAACVLLAAGLRQDGFVGGGRQGRRWLIDRGCPPCRARVCRQSGGEGDPGENVTAALPPPREASGGAGRGEAGGGEAAKKAQIQLPLNDKFQLAYTCCKCNARQAIQVSRIAWEKGVVVATCSGCGVRHLIADSGGLLDLTNELNFKNVVDLMQSKGESVMMLDRTDEESLRDMNLKLDEAGKLGVLNATVPDSGQVAEWPPNSTEPSAAEEAAAAAEEAALNVAARQAAPPAQEEEEEEVDSAPIIVQLPTDVSPREGDTLTIQTEFGLLHVPVPGGAVGGQRLEVQGMVEVGLPQEGMPRWVQAGGAGEWQQAESWEVGDVVAVNMPEGRVARVQIPEDALEDGLLRIGYPVVALPARA